MKNTILTILLLSTFISCNNPSPISLEQNSQIQSDKDNKLNFSELATMSGSDTIQFNMPIQNIESKIVSWFALNSGVNRVNYLIEEKSQGDFLLHELKVYNNDGFLIANKLLSDTSFVLKSPYKRTSRAYRDVSWVHIESGLMSEDSLIILKVEKFEIVSLLGPEHDSKFIKANVE